MTRGRFTVDKEPRNLLSWLFMETKKVTVDLPDGLWRRAKAKAALNGEPVQDFVARCLERCLSDEKGDSK